MPKSDRQLREEIAHNRKLLRERKRQAIGTHPCRPRSYTKDGHEWVFGVLAKTQRRIDVFTAAGGEVIWWDKTDPETVEELAPANCQLCAETHYVGWLEGEWDHQCKLRKKCDAVKCSAFGCNKGHVARHGRFPKWTPKGAEA